MASAMISGQPVTVAADDVDAAQRTAALQRLVARNGTSGATITTADGQSVEVAGFLMVALQQLAALLAQGDDVALVPVNRDLSPTEAAALLHVSLPHLVGLLDAHAVPSTETGDDRHVRLSDLLAYMARRSSETRRDLATALCVMQYARAYD